jgi:hypothetical protein
MHRKSYLLVLPCLVWLSAGCASRKESIEFNDSFKTAPENQAVVVLKEPGLTKSELVQIELEVFSYLLARDFGEDGQCSAIFIAAEESRTEALVKKFPRHVPPLKAWWHLDQQPGQSPRDLDTGRPAMVLSADVADPESGVVTAIGKWFAGDAVSGHCTFELKKDGGNWVIQSVK